MKHVIEGVRAFAQRYVGVFRSAWASRRELDSPERSDDERAFLPAHLELIETPVSPTVRWTMRTIVAFFCIALLWACLGKLDIVAVAPGKTVADSRTKIIQPAETAVVRRILVRDGQRVMAGEALIELDATTTGAELTQAGETLIEARLAALRLTALAIAIDSGLAPRLASAADVPAGRFAAEQ
ncbi:biotin/lipoyl-binding protein, partial [Xanthomonas sp. CFBP 8703]